MNLQDQSQVTSNSLQVTKFLGDSRVVSIDYLEWENRDYIEGKAITTLKNT